MAASKSSTESMCFEKSATSELVGWLGLVLMLRGQVKMPGCREPWAQVSPPVSNESEGKQTAHLQYFRPQSGSVSTQVWGAGEGATQKCFLCSLQTLTYEVQPICRKSSHKYKWDRKITPQVLVVRADKNVCADCLCRMSVQSVQLQCMGCFDTRRQTQMDFLSMVIRCPRILTLTKSPLDLSSSISAILCCVSIVHSYETINKQ